MADLFSGQTMTYAAKFQYDAGGAFNFIIPFKYDKVAVYNYTSWGNTSVRPLSVFFRGFPSGDALQEEVIVDNGGTGEKNLILETTNGFTVADTDASAPSYFATITGVSQADPCVVTTSPAHGYQTDQIVRITDLGSDMPTARGMDQINNKRFQITVLSSTTFSLQDPVTGENIDSTAYTAYVSGGRATLETRVLSLNNPQVSPYNVTPYVPNPYEYNAPVYQLTFGSAIFDGASDNDIFYFEAIKYGQFVDLGDLANLR
jgi:hypothetical protein